MVKSLVILFRKRLHDMESGTRNRIEVMNRFLAARAAHLVCTFVNEHGFGRYRVSRFVIRKFIRAIEIVTPLLTIIALGPTSSSIALSVKLLMAAYVSGDKAMATCSSQRGE